MASEADPGRVTFLLVGLFAGLVVGGALAWRLRFELDGARAEAAKMDVELATVRAERDALRRERDELEAGRDRYMRRALDAERNLQEPAPAPDPARQAKVGELLKLLGDPAAPSAAP